MSQGPDESKPPQRIARLIAAFVAIMTAASSILGIYLSNWRLVIGTFIGMMIALTLLMMVNHAAVSIYYAKTTTDAESKAERLKRARFWELLVRILAVFCLGCFMYLTIKLLPLAVVYFASPPAFGSTSSIAPPSIPVSIMSGLRGPDPLGVNVEAVYQWGPSVIPTLYIYLKEQENENSHIHALNVLEKFGTVAFAEDTDARVAQILKLIGNPSESPGARSTTLQLLTKNAGYVYRSREAICDVVRKIRPEDLSTPDDLTKAKSAFGCPD